MYNYFISNFKTGYHKFLLGGTYSCPLSPLLLYALQSRISVPFHDGIKSDIWSLGMTILSICLKIDYRFFYDFENLRVRYDQIKRRFDDMRERGFSEDLVWLLAEMLEETEARRISLEGIEEMLENVQDEDSYEIKIKSPEKKSKATLQDFYQEISVQNKAIGNTAGDNSSSQFFVNTNVII